MKARTYITVGMALIVISALASLQSALSSQRSALLAYLSEVGLVVGFIVVVYGTLRLRSKGAESGSRSSESH